MAGCFEPATAHHHGGAGVALNQQPGLGRGQSGEATVAIAFQQNTETPVKATGVGFGAEIIAHTEEVELPITIEVHAR